MGEPIPFAGVYHVPPNLKIAYVPQDSAHLRGSLKDYMAYNNLKESLFKAILRKLVFSREQFEKDLADYSQGQKKKILIAKSLSEQANLYIWDEPLNYIDVLSRIQIENLIKTYAPTMILVEHDGIFEKETATGITQL